MSKSRAKTRKKQAGQQEEDKSENRLFYLVMMLVIGPAAIVGSVGTGYYIGILLGLAFIFWGVWETPEIHPYLKLIINWKSRKQQVDVSESPGSKVVSLQGDVGRDVNVYQVSSDSESVEDANRPRTYWGIAPSPSIDDTPMLEPKTATTYSLRVSKDETLTIEVNSDEPVSVELLSLLEWENKSQNRRYAAERYRDKVRNSNIIYEARRSGEYVLWVYNESRTKQQLGVRVTRST